MDDTFKLSKEKKNEMINALKNYFQKEKDEELGDLAALLLLDFISEELGPFYYNMGVDDAYKYMATQVEDILGLQKAARK